MPSKEQTIEDVARAIREGKFIVCIVARTLEPPPGYQAELEFLTNAPAHIAENMLSRALIMVNQDTTVRDNGKVPDG